MYAAPATIVTTIAAQQQHIAPPIIAIIATDDKGVISIHKGCAVAGLGGDPNSGNWRSGTFEYYVKEKVRSNDPKAVGPFILASLEMEGAGK